MLIARNTKRKGAELLSPAMRLDLLEDEALVGTIVYHAGKEEAVITRGEAVFVMEHEFLSKPRFGRWAERRFTLKGPDGETVAVADQVKEAFKVRLGPETFDFRAGKSKLAYELFPEGKAIALGAVGQRKFWTFHFNLDLPERFDLAFQAWLLVLLKSIIIQRSPD
jgi:hypothetical protein